MRELTHAPMRTCRHPHTRAPPQESAPLPADFTRLFSQGRLHSLAPDPALLTEALDLYARLNVDRAKVWIVVGGGGRWSVQWACSARVEVMTDSTLCPPIRTIHTAGGLPHAATRGA